MSWLGYPNTSGLSQIDYRLVDAISDPVGIADDCHSETLFRLPGCFLCYSPMLSESEQSQLTVVQTPSMKNGYVTFGSFNNLVKVTDAVIETWAKVLLSVERSKLLIKSRQLGNSMTHARVIKRFEAQGVSKDRLLLHEMVPDRLAHLNLYNEIDIALDTFPYNGTTTTCEALWMGVPTLTLEGKTHASRVGSSLLQSVGIGEFVANSPDEFVSKAVSFCADLKALDKLRQSLRSNLMSSRLCSPAPYVESFQSFINEICTKA